VRVVLAFLAMTGAAWADDSGPTFGDPYRFTEQGGAAIYGSVCAGCHMVDGRGATGAGTYPALAGDAKLADAGFPIAMVLRGQRAMPRFGWGLTDEQVAAVVGFVRTGFGNRFVDAVTPADVAAQR
jgi:mono/diheme cytochrome c family protein